MTDQAKGVFETYAPILGAGSESLALFVEALAKFDSEFSESMLKGHDFTLKLEIHGNRGVLLHARTYLDNFRRPDEAAKKLEEKRR